MNQDAGHRFNSGAEKVTKVASTLHIVVRLFPGLYIGVLVILAIGIFGLFGQDQYALAAVYLVPPGFLWVLWADGAPDTWLPWIGVLETLLNLAVLAVLCLVLKGRASRAAPEQSYCPLPKLAETVFPWCQRASLSTYCISSAWWHWSGPRQG
ncbi:hypothetical protein [Primorskyibacter sp. 2E233]|uniref:hypothetical protein n=1 Tax=Primorskyibacter sp. 2E233 TaxID=3413431 RepID=UPI003BEF900E